MYVRKPQAINSNYRRIVRLQYTRAFVLSSSKYTNANPLTQVYQGIPTLTYLPYTALQKCTKTKETIEICDYYPQERQLPYQSLELLNIIITINMLLQLSFYYHYINRFIVIITIAI